MSDDQDFLVQDRFRLKTQEHLLPKEKASTLSYTYNCPKDSCNQEIDYTNKILKDVRVTCLADEDICKEVLR